MPGNIGARRWMSFERFHLASRRKKKEEKDKGTFERSRIATFTDRFRARFNVIGVHVLMNDDDSLEAYF